VFASQDVQSASAFGDSPSKLLLLAPHRTGEWSRKQREINARCARDNVERQTGLFPAVNFRRLAKALRLELQQLLNGFPIALVREG
jgi:hypothetical protein